MDWQGKRVLVTGAGGFIGSHLAERLVEAGARVRVLVRYHVEGGIGRLDGSPYLGAVEVVSGDVGDPYIVRRAAEDTDIIFHLAALSSVPHSLQAPHLYMQVNTGGTLNILQAARAVGVARLVYVSSGAVYGPAQALPIDETHPLHARSPYTATKIAAEKLAESFYHSYGLPVVVLRPFNIFGPRQSMRAVVPTIVAQCLEGDTVRLGNIHPTRDMNYVSNAVDAFIKAAKAPEAVGRVINVCSGEETGIGDLARLVARLVGQDVTIESEATRVRGDDIDRMLGDNSLAQALLGWAPRVSLVDGLQKTIDWMLMLMRG